MIATHHLGTLLRARGLSASDQTVEHVLGAFEDVQRHPDVAEGLLDAREAGLTAATLTNGTAEITRGFLDRAGLGGLVEVTLEARGSGVWKPHRPIMRHATGFPLPHAALALMRSPPAPSTTLAWENPA